MRRDVFQAIADPVRREILEIISTKSLSTNEVLENFNVSKQAIAKQLKILTECGLINTHKEGKERYYTIDPKSLVPAHLWIEQLQSQWEERIDSFSKYIEKLQNQKNDRQ